jgi:hypothetical protein
MQRVQHWAHLGSVIVTKDVGYVHKPDMRLICSSFQAVAVGRSEGDGSDRSPVEGNEMPIRLAYQYSLNVQAYGD